MEKKIKVLVVDDSAFMRKTISGILNIAPDIEVVGTAPDGKFALQSIKDLNPDVITLDVEMSGMDGITTLHHIMEKNPKPVVMISALTKQGAEVTLNALNLGAVDFLQKPSGTISLDMKTQSKQIIEKVKAASKVTVKRSHKHLSDLVSKRSESKVMTIEKKQDAKKGPMVSCKRVVAIGVSTGGPQTLLNMFPKIPASINAAILIVQHMPPTFTDIFAKRLDTVSQITVKEACDGDIMEAGSAYVAPGDFHMTTDKGINSKNIIRIRREPYDTLHRPSVDIMMESVAKNFGKSIVGVLLTGMGHDGVEGMKKIKAGGGKTIAEDESTAIIFGMPKAAIKSKCVDHVLPYPKIVEKVVELLRVL